MHQGRLYYTEEELKPVLSIMRQKPTVVTVYLERPLVIPQLANSAQAILANFGAPTTPSSTSCSAASNRKESCRSTCLPLGSPF
jgi:hypothetical protein